jgi:glyceraldehyde 3-phosphate dehydrogenase
LIIFRAPEIGVDLPLTAVQGDLLSVAAWYDNEWGYTARLAEMAAFLAG